MTDIDRLLRDYGQRWCAAQPPTLSAARVRTLASGSAAPMPTASWSPPPDAIPFADLLPGADVLPLLSRPDPATDGADALPACTAAQVSAQSSADARRMLFLPVGDAHCRLEGAPTISPPGPDGEPVAVPTHPRDGYGGPVAVNFENPPPLTLSWDGWDCAESVEIASIQVTLPEDGGSVTIPGLGTCGSRSTRPARPRRGRPWSSPSPCRRATSTCHSTRA